MPLTTPAITLPIDYVFDEIAEQKPSRTMESLMLGACCYCTWQCLLSRLRATARDVCSRHGLCHVQRRRGGGSSLSHGRTRVRCEPRRAAPFVGAHRARGRHAVGLPDTHARRVAHPPARRHGWSCTHAHRRRGSRDDASSTTPRGDRSGPARRAAGSRAQSRGRAYGAAGSLGRSRSRAPRRRRRRRASLAGKRAWTEWSSASQASVAMASDLPCRSRVRGRTAVAGVEEQRASAPSARRRRHTGSDRNHSSLPNAVYVVSSHIGSCVDFVS